jgi:glycosyl transferase family 25
MVVVRRVLTDWFDRTYVVHLPERHDRMKIVLGQLDRVGIEPEVGRLEIFPGIRPKTKHGFPTAEARGCFLSHREVLTRAMKDNLRRVLIMEDDLELHSMLVISPREILGGLDGMEWGLAYLGHNLEMPEGMPPQFLLTEEVTRGAHFYAVQGAAIGQLVEYLDAVLTREPGDPLGGPMHYDGALTMFRYAYPNVKTVAANPSLGKQTHSRSDIMPKPWDRFPITRELAQLMRGALRFVGK